MDAVEEAARARRFGRALVRINTDLVGKPGRSIHVPKRGVMTAQRIAEGTELDAFTAGTSPAYSTVEIVPFKIVSFAAITQESIDASQFDLIRDHIREAGEALADLEDQEIIWALLGRHYPALSENIPGKIAMAWYELAKSPVLQLVEVYNVTDDVDVTGDVAGID
nr:hypothetical protein [Anaerolineae bacterium]